MDVPCPLMALPALALPLPRFLPHRRASLASPAAWVWVVVSSAWVAARAAREARVAAQAAILRLPLPALESVLALTAILLSTFLFPTSSFLPTTICVSAVLLSIPCLAARRTTTLLVALPLASTSLENHLDAPSMSPQVVVRVAPKESLAKAAKAARPARVASPLL
jgi:hypothetical protein